MRLKKLRDQVVVITGASSGIGLLTADLLVARGARVVLAARHEQELALLSERLNRASVIDGAHHDSRRAKSVATVAIDVSDPSAAERIAERAVDAFGGFDTWVNNADATLTGRGAGRSPDATVDGRLADAPLSDMRRVFETNFWGTVNGSRVALDYLRRPGGVIINIGGVASEDAGQPGIETASRQAVNGFTDALRLDVDAERLPVAIGLLKPTASATFDDVARAIVRCAERPLREVIVGSASRMKTAIAAITPRRQYAGGSVLSDVGRAAPLIAIGALLAAGVAASKRL